MSIEDFYNPNEMHRDQVAEGIRLFVAVVGDALALSQRFPRGSRYQALLRSLLEGAYRDLVDQEHVADSVQRFVRTLLNTLLERIEESTTLWENDT